MNTVVIDFIDGRKMVFFNVSYIEHKSYCLSITEDEEDEGEFFPKTHNISPSLIQSWAVL